MPEDISYQLPAEDENRTFRIERQPEGWSVLLLAGGASARFRRKAGPEGEVILEVLRSGDVSTLVTLPYALSERGIEIFHAGRTYVLADAVPAVRRSAARKIPSGSIAAPMAGIVADVMVAVGDSVEAYTPVAVVEAMKVMATLEAPAAGTVRAVHFKKGDTVPHGAVIVEIS